MAVTQKITTLRRVFSGFRRDESGVAAVEFALTFPIFLSVVILVVEMARIAFTYSAVLHSAEEATRFALVNFNATASEIQAQAEDAMVGLDPANLTSVVITGPIDLDDKTRLITVEVVYGYKPLLPIHKFIAGAAENGFSLSGESKGFITQDNSE